MASTVDDVVGVIVATCDRPTMLSDRSIPSILNQTLPPKFVIIVDDSRNASNRAKNIAYIESINSENITIELIPNHRTPGACGAWNSGIDWLSKNTFDIESTYVAILDDDDSWFPNYLETCVSTAQSEGYDMVASDMIRFESVTNYHLQPAPESLCVDDFLVSNPGIQGSNLFLRLPVMLMAGCFDESLISTTDRDLCIRIAELESVNYGRIPLPLVEHFAEYNRNRLTTAGSETKQNGLTRFWRKYAGRMNENQREKFVFRAENLFYWTPTDEDIEAVRFVSIRRYALVIGFIFETHIAEKILNLKHPRIVGLDVVICGDKHDDEFNRYVRLLRKQGISCFPLYSQEKGKLDEISFIQFYCNYVANVRPGTEVFIVDDSVKHQSGLDILDELGVRPLAAELDINFDSRFASWLSRSRISSALARVQSLHGDMKFRILGMGSEAVVFTDEKTVFKCIDYWKTRLPSRELKFLNSQIGKWNNAKGLYSMSGIRLDGTWAVITYQFEESTLYEGGHLDDMLELLSSCANEGIVCNNIAPKNLIVTNSQVKLIDYGSDIRPWTPLGFEHMSRRAYLSVYHAKNPKLSELMRLSLTSIEFDEMDGYSKFRDRVYHEYLPDSITLKDHFQQDTLNNKNSNLVIGVITNEPNICLNLLHSIEKFAPYSTVYVLDNGCSNKELEFLLDKVDSMSINVHSISLKKQITDAKSGLFGKVFKHRPEGKVGIAQARTMIQRYVGQAMVKSPNSIGWILDDDMRLDERASKYIPFLNEFRELGIHVLLGSYVGSSPNPPLNGIRVQLVDILHNLHWLDHLPSHSPLPNRTEENKTMRKNYPDYYYDLSRKHTSHLEYPNWIEPLYPGETVIEARARLLHDAERLCHGHPVTRPLISLLPTNPVKESRDSVNRGGCTFILDSYALTSTPNLILNFEGNEVRRSDMIWAIINRYRRNLVVKSVNFPVVHEARFSSSNGLNFGKVRAEIFGSAIYAGLTTFLEKNPSHKLEFTQIEVDEILLEIQRFYNNRVFRLECSLYRIKGVIGAIQSILPEANTPSWIDEIDSWSSPDLINSLKEFDVVENQGIFVEFLNSIAQNADDYSLND